MTSALPVYTAHEIDAARRKIKWSWGLAVLGFTLPTILGGTSGWSDPLNAIGASLSGGYYFWCLFWIIEGSLGPFLKKHGKILIPALAINIPSLGCMGCFVMVLLLPVGLLVGLLIGMLVGIVFMGTALVTIFWGCFGGGIYYYRKCQRIARAAPVAEHAAPASPPLVTIEWYAYIDGEQIGPLPAQALRVEIQRRGAEAAAYVAKAGDQEWKPYGGVDLE